MNEYIELVEKIEEIDNKLNGLIYKQQNIDKKIENNNKLIMKRINKLQEYNEINDMQAKITYRQMNEIARLLKSIEEKLY